MSKFLAQEKHKQRGGSYPMRVRAPRGLARLRRVANRSNTTAFMAAHLHPQLLAIRIETSRLDGDVATDLSLAG